MMFASIGRTKLKSLLLLIPPCLASMRMALENNVFASFFFCILDFWGSWMGEVDDRANVS